jgi:formylglycine-generating enzyme required for sulfatase activity
VIGVTWYEAYAFTSWLSARTGESIRLPIEAEWEKAARGTDKRIYPYPGALDAAKGNTSASKIGRTSAAGIFLAGASPYGALDMSGNVFDWCVTKWRGGYKNKADNTPEGTDPRVMRGGSWLFGSQFARVSSRSNWFIDYWYVNVGFRLARSEG